MNENEKIAVIGAGQMGIGIAHGFALARFPVTVVDIRADALDKALTDIRNRLHAAVRRGKIAEAEIETVMARIACTQDTKPAVAGASLVIETASEALKTKMSILAEISAAAPDTAIIATNTAALGVTELATVPNDPGRVAGMRLRHPAHEMKPVEIIRGLETTDETVAKLRDWSERIGKTSIVVNEAPGFTTSRISALPGTEAKWMLSEGVASVEDIETVHRMAFNHSMGRLELADLTEGDARLAVPHHLHATLGENFRPCPVILKMVKARRYGRKVGRGGYSHAEGQKLSGSEMRA